MVVKGRRKVVFVVDDDAGMRKSIALLLDKFGFDTQLYASAEAFLSTAGFSQIRNSCIVVDIQLDGMSGIELARQISQTGHALPIIFITGNDNESLRKAALQQDCIAYLAKPFPAKALMDAIDQALA